MSRKLAIILLGFFIVAAAFGPRLTLASSMLPKHSSCHEAPVEMPAACAVHCLTNAINENEVDFNLVFSPELFVPAVVEDFVVPEIFVSLQSYFEKATVFRDAKNILTTIKRE